MVVVVAVTVVEVVVMVSVVFCPALPMDVERCKGIINWNNEAKWSEMVEDLIKMIILHE